MRPACRRVAAAALAFPLFFLSGCLWTTRKLPIPKAPAITQTVTPDELVDRLNERWNALDTLVATVQIQASVMKTQKGEARDYTSFPGHILFRKPEHLRVLGQVPVLGTKMFDMASDGSRFTLLVPSRNTAFEGPNELTHKSTNAVENMRPGFFLDAMVVRGLSPEDVYEVAADTDIIEDTARKHLTLVPEYVLSVIRPNPHGKRQTLERVIHFHRDDLLPYQQDLYDAQGNLETEVTYGRYADYGDNHFPSTVTIKRPLEEYQVVLTVQKVERNLKLGDSQFQFTIPPDTKIQTLR